MARDLLSRILVMMISQNGLRVLQARYLRGDGDGRITETPEQLFDRVARSVSEAELLHGTAADAKYWEERFHSMLSRLDFPNSPTLINAGSSLGELSACASEVAAAYLLAYRLGCKGVTVFRYGSKSETMLERGVGETSDEREHFTKCDPEACRF